MKAAPAHVVTRVLRAAQVLLQGAYVGAIVVGTPAGYLGPGNIIRGDDSRFYEYAARHVPWDPIAAKMAPLMPAVYSASGANPRVLVIVQTVLAVLAWQWLASAAGAFVARPWLRCALVAAVLGISVTPEVIIWNVAIGSEGVAMSLMAAMVAALLRAVRLRTPAAWTVAGSLVALSMLARDTFVVVAGAAIVAALWIVVTRRSDRAIVRTALSIVVLCTIGIGASQWLANRGDPPRWYYPLQENIALRIVDDPNLLQWFRDQGMPQIDEVRDVGHQYFVAYTRLNEAPEFAPFRSWLRTKGQEAYIGLVVRHPWWVAHNFVDDRDQWIEPDISMYTSIPHASPGALYGAIGAVVFWRSPPLLVAVLMLVALGAITMRRWWRRDDAMLRLALVSVWLTGMVHVLFAYVGDVLEVGRHTIIGATQVRIVMWMVLVLLIDRRRTSDDVVSAAAQE